MTSCRSTRCSVVRNGSSGAAATVRGSASGQSRAAGQQWAYGALPTAGPGAARRSPWQTNSLSDIPNPGGAELCWGRLES